MKRIFTALIIVLLVVLQSAGQVLCCLRTCGAGVRLETGKLTVAYPVDAPGTQVLDGAAEKDATKVKVIIGRCTRVSDGDTIHVVTDDNVKYKVRLDRIDAPESDQPYGKESAAYLSSLIRGKTVRVEWQKKDRYQRILGVVFVEEWDVNLQMVKDGFAWHYKFYDKTLEYAQAEDDARAGAVGLWNDPNPIPPWDWRRGVRTQVAAEDKKRPPSPFDYYKPSKKYPGEFGSFDEGGFRAACLRQGVCSRSEAEKAAKDFRRYWEYGQFLDSCPDPESYRSERSFAKAYAGWSFKRDGVRLEDVRESELNLRFEKTRLNYLMWKIERDKRIKMEKELRQLETTARKYGIDLNEGQSGFD